MIEQFEVPACLHGGVAHMDCIEGLCPCVAVIEEHNRCTLCGADDVFGELIHDACPDSTAPEETRHA
jgi:hypothetical protein